MRVRSVLLCTSLVLLTNAPCPASAAVLDVGPTPDSGSADGDASSPIAPDDGRAQERRQCSLGPIVTAWGRDNIHPTLQGVVRQTNPTQKGHFHYFGEPGDIWPASQCGVPNGTPPIFEPGVEWHYSAYKFMNARATDACVTIQLYYYSCGFTEPCPPEITCKGPVSSGICGGVGALEVAVYRNAFDPSDIRKNYLADSTRITAGFTQDHIELTVPAASDFVVVVSTPQKGNTVGNGLGYDPYFDLWVVGCGETDGGVPAPSGSAPAPSESAPARSEDVPARSDSVPAPATASDDDTASGPSVGLEPPVSKEVAGSGCAASGTTTSALGLAGLGGVATALVIRRRRTSRRTE